MALRSLRSPCSGPGPYSSSLSGQAMAMAMDLDLLMWAAKYEGARASAELLLKTEGARNRRPDRLCEQHGMARKGEEEMEARRGVQGVSSSAWFEMMNVP